MTYDIVWRAAAFEQMAALVRVFADRAAAFSAALRHTTPCSDEIPTPKGSRARTPIGSGSSAV
jgi:hypothetical protein